MFQRMRTTHCHNETMSKHDLEQTIAKLLKITTNECPRECGQHTNNETISKHDLEETNDGLQLFWQTMAASSRPTTIAQIHSTEREETHNVAGVGIEARTARKM